MFLFIVLRLYTQIHKHVLVFIAFASPTSKRLCKFTKYPLSEQQLEGVIRFSLSFLGEPLFLIKLLLFFFIAQCFFFSLLLSFTYLSKNTPFCC